MKIIINYDDDRSMYFNEKETNILLKKINYFQLINLLTKSPKHQEHTIIINKNKINTKDIKSLELIFK